tara:strand:+ start:719 stop:970 length:252 start_codon:yes stop_codon:yes gene_type:complete
MKIEKIDNIENYVVLTYPQFTAKIQDIECRIFGVCYNNSGLEDIECITEQTEENIFDKLPKEVQNDIEKILLDILGDETSLTY